MDVWQQSTAATQEAYGHRLFTILAYDAGRGNMIRLHSTRPDINPPGGAKLATESTWTHHVPKQGRYFVGSTREDIQSVFSEYETLWSIGCEKLNIPVRHRGTVIGTPNLLADAHHYDGFDERIASVFAQLKSPYISRFLADALEVGGP